MLLQAAHTSSKEDRHLCTYLNVAIVVAALCKKYDYLTNVLKLWRKYTKSLTAEVSVRVGLNYYLSNTIKEYYNKKYQQVKV